MIHIQDIQFSIQEISELYSNLIRYLVVLFIKFNKDESYKRWSRSDRLIISYHNIPFLISKLKFRDSKSTIIEVYNNYVEITNINNSKEKISNFINISALENIDKNKATFKKLINYLRKYSNINISLLTNLNCVFFLIVACEIKNNNSENIFRNLIFYDDEDKLYKFKYSVSKIYNFVDFKVSRRSVKFAFLTSDEGVSLISSGILFFLNNICKNNILESDIYTIIVPAINALTFVMQNNSKKYRQELAKIVSQLNPNVIEVIRKNRGQIQKESQITLSELVIDNILDIQKKNTFSESKNLNREKYIIENTEIDEVWPFIYKEIDVNKIHPIFVIIYFLINDKSNKIKGFIKDLYFNSNFISNKTNKQNKKDIYEIIYLQYKGCVDIKKIVNEDVYDLYIDVIQSNILNIKNIFDSFPSLFKKFNITDLSPDIIQKVISKYTSNNKENKNNGLLNVELFQSLNLNHHQYMSLVKMYNKDKFILSLEQGMGKTRTIIAEILYLYLFNKYKNFIAIIPATYIDIWKNEIEKVKEIISIKMPEIIIISLEQYRLKSLDFLIKKCFKGNEKFSIFNVSNIYLCIDESIVIKNQDSKNYKCCKKISSLMEMAKIINPEFQYKIRMTTGTIQSENINDWKYVSSFLFNLKENAINLDAIIDNFIHFSTCTDKQSDFKFELNKFRAANDMIMIKRRNIPNVNVVKKEIEINFWKNNPFNGIIQFFEEIKQNLNYHISGISNIIGRYTDNSDSDKADENNFNNLSKALKSGKINNLLKDLNISRTDTYNEISRDTVEKYQKYKLKFLWILRELAELVMPFKIYGFFYNLDAGIISNKIISKTIIDNCIFEKIYKNYCEPYELVFKLINNCRDNLVKNEEDTTSNNKSISSTVSNILNKLHDYSQGGVDIRVKNAIEVYRKATEEIENKLFEINCVFMYIIDYTLIKNNIKNYSINSIKTLVKENTKNFYIFDLSHYFQMCNEILLIDDSVLAIENIINSIHPNGLVYYDMRLKYMSDCIESEIKQNHTMIIFFELKSHIQILRSYLDARNNSYKILELDSKSKDRDKIVHQLNNRKFDILFTTYSLAARGFSFNNTNTIIFFMPTSQYDLYTQAKYRNNRLDSKLSTIYHYDFKYDIFSINNKLYNMYIKKEITKNLMENILLMPYDNLMNLYNILDKSETYFSYLYDEMSNFIKSNEISKKEYVLGLLDMYHSRK